MNYLDYIVEDRKETVETARRRVARAERDVTLAQADLAREKRNLEAAEREWAVVSPDARAAAEAEKPANAETMSAP